MNIVETHAHLDFKDFDKDRSAVLERARQAGVRAFINIALHPGEADKTLALIKDHDDVFAAVGIHPHAAGDYGRRLAAAVEELRRLAQSDKVVALGEMGLDYYRDYAPRTVQQRVFEAQLELARELQYPVIIHCREAATDVLERLAGVEPEKVVFHCFSGNEAVARRCAERGYYIGIGGVLTYPNAHDLREIVRWYPRDRVVLETDCPFLAPQPRRGRRNEPAYLTWVVETLAELWQLAATDVAAITTRNAVALFSLPVAES